MSDIDFPQEPPTREITETTQTKTTKTTPTNRWVFVGQIVAAILLMALVSGLLYLIFRKPVAPVPGQGQGGQQGGQQGGASGAGSGSGAGFGSAGVGYPMSRPAAPALPTVQTAYGALTGKPVVDTHKIFPIGSVVTIYSPFSKGYLRMVNDNEGVSPQEHVSVGGAVVQADGKSATDLAAQWIVKAPFKYVPSVRLDNAKYDALYLAEAVPKSKGGEVRFMPSSGVEWSDFLATTINFVDTEFESETDKVVVLGVETALLNDIDEIDRNTHFLMGTDRQGTMMNAVDVGPGPSSAWEVNVVGKVDANGHITYS
jgi:hypothetical protein